MEDESSPQQVPTYRIFRDKHGIPQFSPKRGTQALTDALAYSFPTLSTELELMQAALRKFFDSERGSKFVFELPQRDLQASLAKSSLDSSLKEKEISPAEAGKASLKSWKLPLGQRRGRRGSRASSRASSRPPSRALSRVSSRADTPITRPATPAEGDLGGKLMTWVLSSGQEVKGAKKQPYDPVKRRKVAENRGNVCDKHRAAKTACDPEVCPRNKGYGKAIDQISKDINDLACSFSSLPTLKEIRIGDAANKMNVTSTHSTSLSGLENIPISNNLPADEVEMFWEASENLSGPSNTESSPFPDFGHSSINSETLFSSEIPHVHDHPRPSYGSQTLDEPNLCSTNTLDTDFELGNEIGAGFEEDFSHPPQYPAVMEDESQIPFDPSLDSSTQWYPEAIPHVSGTKSVGHYSEDPFMGWASKRSSQMCQDYGWVLSHVETL